jgi:hypothetical protein
MGTEPRLLDRVQRRPVTLCALLIFQNYHARTLD